MDKTSDTENADDATGRDSSESSDDRGGDHVVAHTDGGTKAPRADGGPKHDSKDASTEAEPPTSACTGISIGARCVKNEHITTIDRHPQSSDPEHLVYQFDKSYENIGGLLKNKPKIAPDADLGEWYLYNGDYNRGGVSRPSFVTAGGKIEERDRLPQREGLNKDLTWPFTAVKGLDGGDIVVPNCLVCHFAYFDDKLIRGLGRNKHWVASDASGFNFDPIEIAIAAVPTLDIAALGDFGFLLRILPEATSYSHLFDLFAALAMKHDPNTLKWTGDLAGGDPNSHMKGWIDFPAWWHFKKKNALYANASGQGNKGNHLWYMNWFSLDSVEEAQEVINNFAHVEKFLEDKVATPKYEDFGHKIDKALAAQGEKVFLEACAKCHGTYSANDADETYPNALVDLDEIGTEPTLATNHWIYPVDTWYSKSWYAKQDLGAKIVKTHGYLAPPLDGVFITAPYLHNGSVPTLEQLLDPSKRLATWTSNMSADDYDWDAVGWKDKPLDLDIWTLDQNFGIYNTAEDGNSNKGHTYGAALTPAERKQVLEYLKTL
ncbi:MAG TPA: hypothetical protein VI299_25665 [Polyangiales bacterium]